MRKVLSPSSETMIMVNGVTREDMSVGAVAGGGGFGVIALIFVGSREVRGGVCYGSKLGAFIGAGCCAAREQPST